MMKNFIFNILFGLQLIVGAACVVQDFLCAYALFAAMLTATGLAVLGLFVGGIFMVAIGIWWLWEMGSLRPSYKKGE
jgi:predicted phage tail protein